MSEAMKFDQERALQQELSIHPSTRRAMLFALAALGLVIVGALAVSAWLLGHWDAPMGGPSEGAPPQPHLTVPTLETTPLPDRLRYMKEKEAWLSSSGWVDKAHGVAHVPLKWAMQAMIDGQAHPAPGASAPGSPIAAQTPAASAPPSQEPAPVSLGAVPQKIAEAPRTAPNPQLPLTLRFTDTDGQPARLAQYFDGRRPVILVLGYGRCRELCGTVMQGVLQGLRIAHPEPGSFRVLNVSIDPDETPTQARIKRVTWIKALGADAHDMRIDALVGDRGAIHALTQALGFAYERHDKPDADRDEEGDGDGPVIAHTAGFAIATPQGRVTRFFSGLAVEPKQLRLSLAEAAGEADASDPPRAIQTLLRCAHFDASGGSQNDLVMRMMQGLGLLTLMGLGTWIWRHRAMAPKAPA